MPQNHVNDITDSNLNKATCLTKNLHIDKTESKVMQYLHIFIVCDKTKEIQDVERDQ